MLSKYVNLFLIPDMVLERHTALMRRYEGCAIFFHLQPSLPVALKSLRKPTIQIVHVPTLREFFPQDVALLQGQTYTYKCYEQYAESPDIHPVPPVSLRK